MPDRSPVLVYDRAAAYIFKLAYDEAQSRWSAGTVLTAHLLRHALEVDQVVEIDYLSGDDAYKKSWMTVRRERIGLMACNLRSIGGAPLQRRKCLASRPLGFGITD
jgi:CelD/BcsL family acetyltransferase involved in cellulose biosynthesis